MTRLRLRVSFHPSVRVAPEHRRVWIAAPETAHSIADLQHIICTTFLQPAQRDVLLSLDGFTLLPSEDIHILRDADIVEVRAFLCSETDFEPRHENIDSRKRLLETPQPLNTVKAPELQPQAIKPAENKKAKLGVVQSTKRPPTKPTTRAKPKPEISSSSSSSTSRSNSSASGSSSSDDEESSSEGDGSSSDSEGESSSSAESSTSSSEEEESEEEPVRAIKPVKTAAAKPAAPRDTIDPAEVWKQMKLKDAPKAPRENAQSKTVPDLRYRKLAPLKQSAKQAPASTTGQQRHSRGKPTVARTWRGDKLPPPGASYYGPSPQSVPFRAALLPGQKPPPPPGPPPARVEQGRELPTRGPPVVTQHNHANRERVEAVSVEEMIRNMGCEGAGISEKSKRKPYEVVTIEVNRVRPTESDPNQAYLKLPVVSATDLPVVGEELVVRTMSLDEQTWQPTISDFARAKVRHASPTNIQLEFEGEEGAEVLEWSDIADARSLSATRAADQLAKASDSTSSVMNEFHMELRRRKEELSR